MGINNENNEETKQSKFKSAFQKVSEIGRQKFQDLKTYTEEKKIENKKLKDEKKLKKYNPVDKDLYFSNQFNIPNLVKIVDDAERRDVELCKNAIGWLEKINNVEVLFLYDEFARDSLCGINFYPSISCDTMYYMDNFEKNYFINVNEMFNRAHSEKLAELRHIAHSLGAKKCIIEISVGISSADTNKKNVSGGKNNVSSSSATTNTNCISERSVTQWTGNNNPVKPKLKWYSKDENIKRLIEMRCSGDNSIMAETLEISCSSTATISVQTAIAIDLVVKASKVKVSSNFENQSKKENNSRLFYTIEF